MVARRRVVVTNSEAGLRAISTRSAPDIVIPLPDEFLLGTSNTGLVVG